MQNSGHFKMLGKRKADSIAAPIISRRRKTALDDNCAIAAAAAADCASRYAGTATGKAAVTSKNSGTSSGNDHAATPAS